MIEQRLFVDCDDTLILVDDSGEIHHCAFWRAESFHANEPLIAFIRKFREEHPEGFIVIWSGGGQEYAYQVGHALGLDDVTAWYMIKDKTTFDLVRENDIVIDDQPIDVAAPIISPDSFSAK